MIDRVNECDRQSRNQLLELLSSISQKNVRFKAILISRPYEESTKRLDRLAKIDIGSNAKRDIIIASYTVESKLTHLPIDA